MVDFIRIKERGIRRECDINKTVPDGLGSVMLFSNHPPVV